MVVELPCGGGNMLSAAVTTVVDFHYEVLILLCAAIAVLLFATVGKVSDTLYKSKENRGQKQLRKATLENNSPSSETSCSGTAVSKTHQEVTTSNETNVHHISATILGAGDRANHAQSKDATKPKPQNFYGHYAASSAIHKGDSATQGGAETVKNKDTNENSRRYQKNNHSRAAVDSIENAPASAGGKEGPGSAKPNAKVTAPRPSGKVQQASSLPGKSISDLKGARKKVIHAKSPDTKENGSLARHRHGSNAVPTLKVEQVSTSSDTSKSAKEESFSAPPPPRRQLSVPRLSSGGELGDISSQESADLVHTPKKEKRKKKKQKKQESFFPYPSCRLDPVPASPKRCNIHVQHIKPSHYRFNVSSEGGIIKLPSGKITIDRGSLSETITLNAAFCDKQKLREGEKTLIFLTPALHLWMEESRKMPLFHHPMEILLASNLSVKDINNPIEVKIHRTSSTVKIDWQFFESTRFGAGPFIAFQCKELGGYRVVTERQPLLLPLNYILCAKRPTDIEDPAQHNFYIALYSDTPEMRDSVDTTLSASSGRTEVVIDQQMISVSLRKSRKKDVTSYRVAYL